MRFAIIPEFFVEDIADFILFSAQYVPLIYLFAIICLFSLVECQQ